MVDLADNDVQRIYDLLRLNTSMRPDAEAVVDGDHRLTYAGLQREVDRYARAMLAVGVKRGDGVATLAPPRESI